MNFLGIKSLIEREGELELVVLVTGKVGVSGGVEGSDTAVDPVSNTGAFVTEVGEGVPCPLMSVRLRDVRAFGRFMTELAQSRI